MVALVVGWLLGLLLLLDGIDASLKNLNSKPPNIIFILADDLGYGDLDFPPFNSPLMAPVKTPNLRSMAKEGLILSNFHAASPLCSPSRAAIMTGIFPWRFGVDFIYAGDLKLDGSAEIHSEQLPMVPNIAMSLKDAGYYTAHVGKWHLGGMTLLNIPERLNLANESRCAVPGILQYGFDEYVAMSEGTGSMRWKTHRERRTYADGSKYLYRNDVPLPPPSSPEVLTTRQTDEAIRIISEQHAKGNPFFVNLWYDAPHR